MDGAGHWNIMARIYVPLSKASIATICLFALVYHWNSWFDGIILMNKPTQYPLQSYLQTIIIQGDTSVNSTTDWQTMALISDRTVKCAQIFLSTLPIVAAYPFLQRYFVKGMVLNKYTGARGKSGSNDANAEYLARLRRIFDENKVAFQTAELGKVDYGGGGTIAYIAALYGMEVVDSGVAVLSMHAPWEIISKSDLYEAKKGYLAFLKNA